MINEELAHIIQLIDLALAQSSDGHVVEARNTLRTLRRIFTGPPELLKRRDEGPASPAGDTPGPDDGPVT